MTSYEDILQKIIDNKRLEIEERKLKLDQLTLTDLIKQNPSNLKSFGVAIKNSLLKKQIAIISELKKASPSKGLIRADYSPGNIAAEYEQAGATCLSILTERNFFLGSDEDLIAAKNTTSIPILRKDFIIDPYQIYESRYIGADCILLIVAALSISQLLEFYEIATGLGLDVIVEVNNERELQAALQTQAELIGINNRNLRDFSVNLQHTIELSKKIPSGRIAICESGIRNRNDIELMQQHQVNVFLIGETLMKADSPGKMLTDLLG
jgi:indole-3-glycerol phosphate synthase